MSPLRGLYHYYTFDLLICRPSGADWQFNRPNRETVRKCSRQRQARC